MKAIIILFSIISIFSFRVNAQYLRMNHGFSITSLKSSKIDVLTDHVISYTTSVGLDYFNKPYWGVSSEIGYIELGGADKIFVESESGNSGKSITVKEKNSYLQLNTTFRLKTPLDNKSLYIGIGPNIDLLLQKNKFNNLNYSGYKLSKLLYSVKSEIGANVYLRKKISIGFNASYLFSLNSYAEYDLNKLKSSTFYFTFMIGYKL